MLLASEARYHVLRQPFVLYSPLVFRQEGAPSPIQFLPFPSPTLPMSRQGLLDFAFGPMFSESGYPSYFYLSYTCMLDGEVSGEMHGSHAPSKKILVPITHRSHRKAIRALRQIPSQGKQCMADRKHSRHQTRP